ncbi:MAG: sulfurtransferase complex subunit TusD [Pseudomonadales bacterium]|jgi:tRNA 2-thiouridine synthesizing protein D
MNFAITVMAGPQSAQAPLTALNFARAVVAGGHQLSRVFFYEDGVYTANTLSAPPQDEPDVTRAWSEFAAEYDIDLVICVASALRRGVLDETEADRYDKTAANIADGFVISGLGQLIDSALNADRLVTFK